MFSSQTVLRTTRPLYRFPYFQKSDRKWNRTLDSATNFVPRNICYASAINIIFTLSIGFALRNLKVDRDQNFGFQMCTSRTLLIYLQVF
jgi:hypothetical protein